MNLDTPRLHLRPVETSDLDALLALDADPEVMRYIGPTPSRATYVDELLPRMMRWNGQPLGFFAAVHDGRFVGWFHLRPSVADESILELGYRLERAVWGRGLATEGSLALLRHGFGPLGMPAIDACADPRNAASIRVMVKCGMEPAGRFVHPRAPIEVVRYLVTRERFASLYP